MNKRRTSGRGPGRPRVNPDEKRVPVMFYAPRKTKARWIKASKDAGVSLSEYLLDLLGET